MSATKKNDLENIEVQIKKEQEEKLRTEIEQLQNIAVTSVQRFRLTELNEALGRATSLRETNTIDHLQPQLDDLVQNISIQRQQLRERLGAASTLAVSGNYREAYHQAREYLDRGVMTIIDTVGVLGTAGEEVDSFRFYQIARQRFIDSLRDLVQQRLSLAEGQIGTNPDLALQTLEDVSGRLQDNILSKEDRDELYSTIQMVEQKIQIAKHKLPDFHRARNLVLSTREPGISPVKQYELLHLAHRIYPDYAQIDSDIDATRPLVEAYLRSRLEDLMSTVNHFLERAELNGYHIENEDIDHVYESFRKVKEEALISSTYLTEHAIHYQIEIEKVYQEIQKVIFRKENVARILQYTEKFFDQYQHQKAPELLAQAQSSLTSLDSFYNSNPEVQRYRILIEQAQEQIWVEEAEIALHAQPPDFEEAITKLRLIKQIEISNKGLSLLIEAIRGYIAQRLVEAKEAIAGFNFRETQSILGQLQEQLNDWLKDSSITISITGEVESLLQESTDYREAQRDLGEANDIIQRNVTGKDVNVDELLQKALKLPDRSAAATTLRRDAELLRSYKSLYQADYDTYKQRLLAMLLKNPQDDEIRLRYEKIEDFENKKKLTILRLRGLNIWLAVSVVTALGSLGLAFFCVFFLIRQNSDFAVIGSLLSALPIFATKLVYDRFSQLYETSKTSAVEQPDELINASK